MEHAFRLLVIAAFLAVFGGSRVADADDPSSVWSVRFDPAVFEGATLAPAKPLTSSAGSEVFAAAAGDWIVYTISGFGDLDIYALPMDGTISANSYLACPSSSGVVATR